MKYFILMAFVTLFSACGAETQNTQTETGSSESILEDYSKDRDALPTSTVDYARYYIVIADTSINYEVLQKKMLNLRKQLSIPIDTMDRYYDKDKNLICLPEDSDDELYAGDYFPRRFPSESLSLEYLNLYQQTPHENKTIALVSGIY